MLHTHISCVLHLSACLRAHQTVGSHLTVVTSASRMLPRALSRRSGTQYLTNTHIQTQCHHHTNHSIHTHTYGSDCRESPCGNMFTQHPYCNDVGSKANSRTRHFFTMSRFLYSAPLRMATSPSSLLKKSSSLNDDALLCRCPAPPPAAPLALDGVDAADDGEEDTASASLPASLLILLCSFFLATPLYSRPLSYSPPLNTMLQRLLVCWRSRITSHGARQLPRTSVLF